MCGFRKVLRTPWHVVQTSALLQPVDITDAERYAVPVPTFPPSLLAAALDLVNDGAAAGIIDPTQPGSRTPVLRSSPQGGCKPENASGLRRLSLSVI